MKINDPVFGILSSEEKGEWKRLVRLPFVDVSLTLTVFTSDSASGPTEGQRAAFGFIQKLPQEHRLNILDVILSRLTRWDATLIATEQIAPLLEPLSICIIDAHTETLTEEWPWEITFYCERIKHWISVECEGAFARHATING